MHRRCDRVGLVGGGLQMTYLQASLLVIGAMLLLFALAWCAGTVAMWWAMLTREEGDLDDGR